MTRNELTQLTWPDRLAWAISTEKESELKRYLICLSLDWRTCAVGELCSDLPMMPPSKIAPIDINLWSMGIKFNMAVQKLNYDEAILQYNRIKDRAAYLRNPPDNQWRDVPLVEES
jgi:hypothetical protein